VRGMMEPNGAGRGEPTSFALRAELDPDIHWLQSHAGSSFIQCTTRIRRCGNEIGDARRRVLRWVLVS